MFPTSLNATRLERQREALQRGGHEFGKRVAAGLQRVVLDEAVALGFLALQAAQVHAHQRSGQNRAVRFGDDRPGDRARGANGVAWEREARQLLAHAIARLVVAGHQRQAHRVAG